MSTCICTCRFWDKLRDGDKDAGFRNSNEYLAGMNYYLAHSRNYRLNVQVIRVNRPPAGEQLLWVLRRRPEGYNCFDGAIDFF